MHFEFFKVSNQNELDSCFSVMNELRPHVSKEQYLSIYYEAHHANGYEIVGFKKDSQVVAVMGYRFLQDLVHGKHLYIDDLVCTETMRSQGLGARLLKYAEEVAFTSGCTGLRLCTGIENESGKKFYEKNNWNLRAIVYKKKIKQP